MQIQGRIVVLVVDRQLLRHSERLASRNDGDLMDRVGVLQHGAQQGVTRLVNRRDLLLLVADDE